MKIAIVSILALLLIFLSFKFKKQAKQKNDPSLKIFSSLFFLTGINILVIGNTVLILGTKGWSTDNLFNLAVISTITIALSFLIIGLKFLLHSNKTGIKLGAVGAGIFIITIIGGALYVVKLANYRSSGWTSERQKVIVDNVDDVQFRKLCYLDEVMKMFPNPDDYNDKTEKQLMKLNELANKNCKLCDEEFIKRATKEVEGLPDDF